MVFNKAHKDDLFIWACLGLQELVSFLFVIIAIHHVVFLGRKYYSFLIEFILVSESLKLPLRKA